MKILANTIRVLLVDSRPIFLAGLETLINAEKPRMEVVGRATSYAMALDLSYHLQPDVILLSFFRDELDSLDVIKALTRRSDTNTRVLVIKGGAIEPCPITGAIKAGAHGFVLSEEPTTSITRAIVNVQDKDAGITRVWAAGLSSFSTRRTEPPNGEREEHPNGEREKIKLARLTTRERELVRAIVENPSAKYFAIGEELGISEHTVHNHLSSIYSKLGLINRLDLLVFALRNKLIDGTDAPGSHWADLS